MSSRCEDLGTILGDASAHNLDLYLGGSEGKGRAAIHCRKQRGNDGELVRHPHFFLFTGQKSFPVRSPFLLWSRTSEMPSLPSLLERVPFHSGICMCLLCGDMNMKQREGGNLTVILSLGFVLRLAKLPDLPHFFPFALSRLFVLQKKHHSVALSVGRGFSRAVCSFIDCTAMTSSVVVP